MKRLDRVGLHHPVADQVEHELLEHGPADRLALVAAPELAGVGAGEVVAADRGHVAAAVGAAHEAGQQVRRPAVLPEAAGLDRLHLRVGVDLGLARLHALPERIVDDAQLGHLFGDPGLRRVGPRDAPAGRRVLDVAQPVPDQPADVELVVEDAGAALAVAADRGVAPEDRRAGRARLRRSADARSPSATGRRRSPRRSAGRSRPRSGLMRAAAALLAGDDVVAVAEAAAAAAGRAPGPRGRGGSCRRGP